VQPQNITTTCTSTGPGAYSITPINTTSLFPGGHTGFDPFLHRSHQNQIPLFLGYPLYYHGDGTHGVTPVPNGVDTTRMISGTLPPGKHEFSIMYDNEC